MIKHCWAQSGRPIKASSLLLREQCQRQRDHSKGFDKPPSQCQGGMDCKHSAKGIQIKDKIAKDWTRGKIVIIMVMMSLHCWHALFPPQFVRLYHIYDFGKI